MDGAIDLDVLQPAEAVSGGTETAIPSSPPVGVPASSLLTMA